MSQFSFSFLVSNPFLQNSMQVISVRQRVAKSMKRMSFTVRNGIVNHMMDYPVAGPTHSLISSHLACTYSFSSYHSFLALHQQFQADKHRIHIFLRNIQPFVAFARPVIPSNFHALSNLDFISLPFIFSLPALLFYRFFFSVRKTSGFIGEYFFVQM